MKKVLGWPVLGCAGLLALASLAWGQARSYIGFVYPAGGRQGTTFRIKLGGQGLDGVDRVVVTGGGVTAKIVDYHRRLGNQETTLLREQLNELRGKKGAVAKDEAKTAIAARIQGRMDEYVNQPACVSLSNLVFAEVTIAPDAAPGPRELRLVTSGGASNPLPFHVGQLPENVRKPMQTCPFQVLGKEEQALRKRPPEEAEQRVTLPCTLNGQVAPGEVNSYRFAAKKGQKLVFSVAARQLIPFIADAVPGWFQPVISVGDDRGKELAYNDDFRFKPDPALFLEIPRDGEYLFTITDAIFRGREDFVYRVTAGEIPFVTGAFPLGGPAGNPGKIELKGWNLESARLLPPPANAGPGICRIGAGKDTYVSNRVPFLLDTHPEASDKEPNDSRAAAQKVKLPVVVNGRMDRAKDEDVFLVEGRSGDTLVAEVMARRLDSPMDSMLKVTDSAGRLLAINDDHQDPAAGENTHHADSYLMVKVPADGICYVHLTDTTRQGGPEYAYRLRLSAPEPDFLLRVMPSSLGLRSRGNGTVSVYALRRDGFAGDIKLSLKTPPEGWSAAPVTLPAAQDMVKFAIRTTLKETKEPVALVVEGRATVDGKEIVREAMPTEDRMQAFLWRHLLPAQDLKASVFDPSNPPPPKKVPPTAPVAKADKPASSTAPSMEMQDMASMTGGKPEAGKTDKPATPAPTPPKTDKPAAPPGTPAAATPPKFTKQMVAGRLRQLKVLYEDGLLTDEFYLRKVAECEEVAR
jgi:hypothetical protein